MRDGETERNLRSTRHKIGSSRHRLHIMEEEGFSEIGGHRGRGFNGDGTGYEERRDELMASNFQLYSYVLSFLS